MTQDQWLAPVSLDAPVIEDTQRMAMHETIPVTDPEMLRIELVHDFAVISPLDLKRTLYYAAGYSYHEIAALEGTSAAKSADGYGAVKQSVYRTRRKVLLYLQR